MVLPLLRRGSAELPLNMVSIHNAMEKYSEYKDDIFYYIALGGNGT